MDSNSAIDSKATLAPNLQSSSGRGERCRLQSDQLTMATYNDNHSESDQCIAYRAFPRLRSPIASRIAAFLEHEEEQRPVCSCLQKGDLFYDSLVVSGTRPRARNPWATVASVTLLPILLLALIVVPLFHTDSLPKRQIVTTLYVPSAAAASNGIRLPVSTSTITHASTNMKIPSAVHTRQKAPAPAVDTAGGLVGGVPGGVVGGVQGGVLNGVLNSIGIVPALAKAPAPPPKRIRVPAHVAESNLVHDVAPEYPPEAGRARIEGTVVLLAVIDKDGTVRDVRVESGLPVLAQAAIEAVKQWRYRPYLMNGEPVEVDSQITINFNLSRG
jgi:periplasmic protein TonB